MRAGQAKIHQFLVRDRMEPMDKSLPPIPAPKDAPEDLWRRLFANYYESDFELERAMETALVVAPLVSDPLARVGVRPPMSEGMHGPLALLGQRMGPPGRLGISHRPQARVGIDWSLGAEWPEEITTLPASCRVALWLIKAGSDPWAPDEEGLDALDWAVRANARGLINALLSHPQAPPLEQLSQRTVEVWAGKSIPWVHYLSLFNATEVAGDLIDFGLSPNQLDASGWPAAAWASSPESLEFVLNRSPLDSELRKVVPLAWQKREASKWHPGGFIASRMDKALKSLSPLSSKEESDLDFMKKMNELLRATPAKEHYEFGGLLWGRADSDEIKHWATENANQVLKVKAGPARGVWDPWSALLWAAIRVKPRGGWGSAQHRLGLASQGLEEMLLELSEADRGRWLNAPIRPDLTRRDFLLAALGPDRVPSAHPKDMGADEVLGLMVDASLLMLGKNASADWHACIEELLAWSTLPLQEELSFAPQSPVWGSLDALRQRGVSPWPASLVQRATEEAVACLGQGVPGELRAQAFNLALSYMGVPTSKWQGKHTPASDKAHASHQARHWEALAHAAQQEPDVFILPKEYPFVGGPEQLKEGIPSPQAWESFLHEFSLDCALPRSTPSSSPKPRRM